MDILLIGDSTIDEFLKIDEAEVTCSKDEINCKICLPFGSKVNVSEYATSIAGNSINAGVGLAKLGLKVSLDTELGFDAFGNQILNELNNRGINTKYVSLNQKKITNVHQIIFYENGRTILTYHEKYDYKIKNWETLPKILHHTHPPFCSKNVRQNSSHNKGSLIILFIIIMIGLSSSLLCLFESVVVVNDDRFKCRVTGT